VHTARYVEKINTGTLTLQEEATLEVPFSPALREASWLCAGGSHLAGRLALERGVAVHLGGGFHHAFPDHGEGFCLINDVAVAIAALRRAGAVRKALVIDLDVHHGNGTAVVFASDAEVFTFSMHQQNNYPAWKPRSDLDVPLADGTGDEEYLALLGRSLDEILERHRPDFSYYVAGADPYREDQLGGLALTIEGLAARDLLVFDRCRSAGSAVAVAFAGGYAARNADTVEIHCATARAAKAALAST
jgi:acetoin utilization deacetylase AcuC-like enzyme